MACCAAQIYHRNLTQLVSRGEALRDVLKFSIIIIIIRSVNNHQRERENS